jgi:glycosyltransferase involved in cell wall biosynthesis
MTKVCMVVHQYYYRDPRVRRYAELLADAGAQVDVICVRDPGQPSTRPRSGVRVFTIPFSRGYGGQGSYFFEYGVALILYSVWLLALYIRNGYGLVHVHNTPDFLIFAALIPRLLGAKLILDIHDPMPELFMSKYRKTSSSLLMQVLEAQEKLSAGLAHAVITANPTFKSNLVGRGMAADKITVIHNLPDARVFDRDAYRHEDHHDGAHFTLIYPGTIAPRYGLSVPIRALPTLVEKIQQIRLEIIGPQVSYVTELAALAEELGVSAFVTFKPTIPLEEVPRELMRADVGIYTALSDPHIDTAVPTKVLEYAVMGLPIIATRLRVLEDLFPESAICYFESGSVEQFANCVLELFNSSDRRATLVRNADQTLARTHSWSTERQVYLGLLNRLLGSEAGMGESAVP